MHRQRTALHLGKPTEGHRGHHPQLRPSALFTSLADHFHYIEVLASGRSLQAQGGYVAWLVSWLLRGGGKQPTQARYPMVQQLANQDLDHRCLLCLPLSGKGVDGPALLPRQLLQPPPQASEPFCEDRL